LIIICAFLLLSRSFNVSFLPFVGEVRILLYRLINPQRHITPNANRPIQWRYGWMLVIKLEKNESLMAMNEVSVDSLQRKEFCKDFEIKKPGTIQSFLSNFENYLFRQPGKLSKPDIPIY